LARLFLSHCGARLSIQTVILLLLLFVTSAEAQRDANADLILAPAGSVEDDVTRAGLEDAVRRFADRFYTSVTQTTNAIRNAEDQDAATRLLMHQWKTVSAQTIVELAIGQDPATSLLDMMVLTRLSRLMIDGYWTPNALTLEEGQELSDTYAALEVDIWDIGAELLSPDQVATLRELIDAWYRDNPNQTYPWYIRLDEFSDQRALALRTLSRGNSLFGIREARESVEEVQAFGERAMYYLQRAPALLSYELESSVYEILAAEEVASLIENADQFSASLEEMVEVIANIPSRQLAAIDQLMGQLSIERQALMADLRNTSPEAEGALEEARRSLEAFERILAAFDIRADKPRDPDRRPFDIREYQALVEEAGVVTSAVADLLTALEATLASPALSARMSETDALVGRLAVVQERLIDRLFLWSGVLVLFFFTCFLGFRLIWARLSRADFT
jgi:hypothetical protein